VLRKNSILCKRVEYPMDKDSDIDSRGFHAVGDNLPELELSDEDILDAMQHIPGYVDISTEDFREVYHLAHRHALQRLLGRVRVEDLMRTGIEPLRPDMKLDKAAESMARQGLKRLPVVDAEQRVVGMLTETDFLRRLSADTFLELLLHLVTDVNSFSHRCHETPVSEAMRTPAITAGENDSFFDVIAAFHKHEGRSMPLVDAAGHLRGLLLRKDFVHAYHLEDLL
jgi:CBS domain-containing membrane protein